MSAKYDIKIKRGESFTKDIIFDNPKILEGRTAQAQIRDKKESPTKIADFTCLVNWSTGTVTMSLSGAQTLAMEVGTYVYDMFVLGQGFQKCFVEGTFEIDGRATFYDMEFHEIDSGNTGNTGDSENTGNNPYGEDNPDENEINSDPNTDPDANEGDLNDNGGE